jgi:ketosteroid isomerase-like protein
METEKNKQLVKRYLELWNTGDSAIAAEILAPDYVDHTHPNREPGPESRRRPPSVQPSPMLV